MKHTEACVEIQLLCRLRQLTKTAPVDRYREEPVDVIWTQTSGIISDFLFVCITAFDPAVSTSMKQVQEHSIHIIQQVLMETKPELSCT